MIEPGLPLGFVQVMERATAVQSTPVVMEEVIQPLMTAIGERWRMGRMRACHEHFASAHLRSFLGEVLAQASTLSDGPALLVTTPSSQTHELGALMAAVIAARAGWRVMYLGPMLPADDTRLPAQLLRLRAQLQPGVPIFAGGAAASGYKRALERIGAVLPDTLADFDRDLEALRRAGD